MINSTFKTGDNVTGFFEQMDRVFFRPQHGPNNNDVGLDFGTTKFGSEALHHFLDSQEHMHGWNDPHRVHVHFLRILERFQLKLLVLGLASELEMNQLRKNLQIDKEED